MQPYLEPEEGGLNLGDIPAIVKRRIWSLILPTVIVVLLAAVAAMVWPPTYRSSAVVLVEAQEIPADFVMTTVTSYVEQRVQNITQRILSTSRLLTIINDLDLYKDIREKTTQEGLVEKLRQAIKIKPISVETVDPRTGRPGVATGAVEFSFEGDLPKQVQRVTDTIVTHFLEANLTERKRQTAEAESFLKEEMARVKKQLTTMEAELADFKEKHINSLPEMLAINQQTISSLETQVARLKDQLRSLREREGYLQTQLASIPEEGDTRQARLRQLELELVNLKTKFTDEYPDVRKLTQEIADLKAQGSRYQGDQGAANTPDNAAYITLASQLASAQSEIGSLQRQITELEARQINIRHRLEQTPQVEESYNALLIERNNTRAKYEDLMRKAMEASMALGLEKEQKGERFTLIEPAQYPEKPVRPNRIAIVVIGVVLGIGSGIGFAALREFTDTSVHGPQDLLDAGIAPVLATIPLIRSRRDIRMLRLRRLGLTLGLVLGAVAVVVSFHFMVMDLDLLWIKLMRRLTI
jgi:polysaccharide chain length determinant protein (PEP-CTERM system associated)